MRVYNVRIGKFLSLDPLTNSYPELTPYQFASNTPIQAVDLDGAESMFGWSIGTPPGAAQEIVKGWQDSHNAITNGTASGIKKSVVKTWNFITRDAWKASTWRNIGNGIEEFIVGSAPGVKSETPIIDAGIQDFKQRVIFGDAFSRSEYFAELGTDAILAKGVQKSFAITKGMSLAEKVAVRTNFAKSFYEKSGFSVNDAVQHIKGIDLKKTVEAVTLKKGTVLEQWTYLDGQGNPKIGNYYTPVGTDPKTLGIPLDGRVKTTLMLTEDTKFLRSTASDVENWQKPGSGEILQGGGIQYFQTGVQAVIKK